MPIKAGGLVLATKPHYLCVSMNKKNPLKVITVNCSCCLQDTVLKPVTFKKYNRFNRYYKVLEGYICANCGYLMNKLIGV